MVDEQCREDDPMLIAWKAYQQTPEFSNTRRWLFSGNEPYALGSMWAIFRSGWLAAKKG